MADDYIEPPAADPTIELRLAGVGWDEIDERERVAMEAGYSPDEINAYLRRGDTTRAQARMNGDWSARVAGDEQLATGLRSASHDKPLSREEALDAERVAGYANKDVPSSTGGYVEAPPAGTVQMDDYARGSYANAFLRGEVRSPLEWAERFVGAAWNALGDVDPAAMIRSAGQLASSLPSPQELTDAAIATQRQVGSIDPTTEEVRFTRAKLADEWAETGKPLMSFYEHANADPDYAASLVVPPVPEKSFWERVGEQQELDTATEQEAGNLVVNHFLDLAKDWKDWGNAKEEIAKSLEHMSLRERATQDAGIEEALRVALGVGAPLAIARHGLRIGRIVRGMSEPEVPIIDLEKGLIEYEKASTAMADVRPAARAPAKATVEGKPAEPTSPLEFAPEAKPAEKMEALSRDWQEAKLGQKAEVLEDLRLRNEGILPDEFAPDFFTRLAAKQDAPTLALAEGMDAARGFMRFLRDTGGALARDELGAVNLGRIQQSVREALVTGRDAAERAAYAANRDFARQLMRAGMGEVSQAEAAIARRFMEKVPNGQRTWYGTQKTVNMYKLVAPHIAEFEAEIAKGPAGNVRGTIIGNFIEHVEGRSYGAGLRHDSPLAPLANLIRDVNQGIEGRMRAAEAQGLHSLKSYYEDYYRHIWKDPNAVDKAFGVARTGSSASFNLRTIPTTMDGLLKGLEPKFTHPIELTMFDVGEKLRYLKTLEMLAEARSVRSPITGQRTVYFAAKPRNSDAVALMGAGTRRVIPKAGMPDLQVYAPRGFATNWNNTVGTGFFNREFSGKLFEQLMYIKNLATQTSLAGPIYHSLAITEEVLATGFANAAHELIGGQRFLFKGQLGKWAEEMGRGLYDASTSATRIKAIENYIRGRSGIANYEKGTGDAATDYLTQVNFRFNKHRQDMYKMGTAPSLWETVAKGDLKNEFWRQMKYLAGNPKEETLAYRALRAPTTRLLGTAGYYAGKMWNTTAAPLFEHLIPIMKVGSGLEHMRTFLRQNPTATEAQKLTRARQISDAIDNRLGELNFDNVFWPRAVKQSLQASMISPGWVYGELRGFASGVLQFNIERKAFELNPVAFTTSVVGFAQAYVLQNMGYQYIKTGTFPWQTDTPFQDMFVGGRTGATTPEGVPQRGLLPGKQKELFDWAKIIATGAYDKWKVPGAIADYLGGKNYSAIQALKGLITGKDAIGNHIHAQPGGYPAFLLKTLMPISLNSMADRKNWTGVSKIETFLGIRDVPTFAQDPEKFYKVLEAVDHREAQEQYRRVLRENQTLETPRELPELPENTSAKGYPIRQGGGTRQQSGGSDVGNSTYMPRGDTTSAGNPAFQDPGQRSSSRTGTRGGSRASRARVSTAYTPWRTRRRRRTA